jgi:hypothetical protein
MDILIYILRSFYMAQSLKKFAKRMGMSEDDLYQALVDNGYLKAKTGAPKAKFIEEGLFDEDGNIDDADELENQLSGILESSDEEDEEEEEKSSKKSKSKKSKDDEEEEEVEDDDDEDEEEDDEDDEESELEFDDVKSMLEDWEFDSRDEVAELIKLLTDKLVDLN